MKYLIDTNVVSEFRRRERADPGVVSFLGNCPEGSLFLSVLTLGEVRKGIERLRLRDPQTALSIDSWIARVVDAYQGRILPIDHRVAEAWGELNAGDPLPVIDSLIAATAKVHGMTLVTRNVRDFVRSGIAVVDPFTR